MKKYIAFITVGISSFCYSAQQVQITSPLPLPIAGTFTASASTATVPIGFISGASTVTVSASNPLPVSASVSATVNFQSTAPVNSPVPGVVDVIGAQGITGNASTFRVDGSSALYVDLQSINGSSENVKALNVQVTAGDMGLITNTVIHGLTTGGGGGYVDVKVNPSGTLTVDASGTPVTVTGSTVGIVGTGPLVVTGSTVGIVGTSPLVVTGSTVGVVENGIWTATVTFNGIAQQVTSTNTVLGTGSSVIGTVTGSTVGIVGTAPIVVTGSTVGIVNGGTTLNATINAALPSGTNTIGKINFANPTTASLSSVSVSTSGSAGDLTQIVGQTAQTVRIWRLFLVVGGATNITFKDGAGGTAFDGALNMTTNGSIILDFDGEPWFVTSSGNGFVINQSGTVQISGRIYYTQS